MSNDILYREFYIKTTAEKLLELSADLREDDRVKDFDKLSDELGKTDTKKILSLLEWMKAFIGDHSEKTDYRVQEKKRQISLLITKLKKKVQ